MAPLRITPAETFKLCDLGVRTTSVLLSCCVLCILLAAKRFRSRHKMPHIEQLTPFTVAGEKQIERDVFDAQDPISELDRQLLMELLNPLLIAGPRQSSLMTSGYLASKAKMARAEKLAILGPAQEQANMLESPTKDLMTYNNLDQRLQWSRRSSPGPQTAVSTLQAAATTDYAELDHLVHFNSLQMASKHDEVRHFCDDHNTRIKWRRRTLIFEKTP